jgi:hypothetical protein
MLIFQPPCYAIKIQGSDNYVATGICGQRLHHAQTPLLVKGDSTGKTMLAEEVAQALDCRCSSGTSSTTKAQQGLRIRRGEPVARFAVSDERVKDIHNYIVKGVLWQAFTSDEPKGAAHRRNRQGRHRIPERSLARDRPHEFYCRDTRVVSQASAGSVITSNNEKGRPTPSCAAASSTTSSSRRGNDEEHRGVHFPPEAGVAHLGHDEDLLRRAQPARPEEEQDVTLSEKPVFMQRNNR